MALQITGTTTITTISSYFGCSINGDNIFPTHQAIQSFIAHKIRTMSTFAYFSYRLTTDKMTIQIINW